MRQTLLDSTTKEALRKMVRGLRQPLIDAFLEHAKSEYQLDVPASKARLTEAPPRTDTDSSSGSRSSAARPA